MATGGKVDISQLRNLVRQYVDNHQYKTALFWADKAVTLSSGDVQDVYWLAQTLFLSGQFQRAIHTLKSQDLSQKNLACRYLAAKCHAECRQWQEALDILEMAKDETKDSSRGPEQKESFLNDSFVLGGAKKLESAMWLLKGTTYEAMDNRSLATDSYKESLRCDVHCYEAFDLLVSHHMLTAEEEKDLLTSLPYEDQCTPEEVVMLKFLYESKTKAYTKPTDPKLPAGLDSLNDNSDIVTSMAERHFYNCNYESSFKLTSAVMAFDPYHENCLSIHISCLVELKKSSELFRLAHNLVDNYPHKATAWYAVGCYYYLIEKYEQARRYFSKATTLERVFGPAWLGFGHAFAAEGEHDQAMAAYFTASKLMPRSHLPLLYIGLEYGKTHNPMLAERFLKQALSLSPDDPFIKQELGVIAHQNGDHSLAERHFREALRKVQGMSDGVLSETWEPLLNNLAHASRKCGKYQEAIQYHQQALMLVPNKASTFSAIGFVHSIMGNLTEAVDYFHKALGIQREDTFSVHMLQETLNELLLDTAVAEEAPPATCRDSSVMEMDRGSEEDD